MIMSEDDMETLRDLDPVKTMQEKLREQGFFSRTSKGVRPNDDGGFDYTYQAIVLSQDQAAALMEQANSEGRDVRTPEGLSWEDLRGLPGVCEGEDLVTALEEATRAYFDQ